MRIRIAGTLLLLLALVSCSSRDHVPADCITPDRFIELYARLLYTRELERNGSPAGAVEPSAAEIAKLQDFVTRADLSPGTWERLLTAVQDSVRVLEAARTRDATPAAKMNPGGRPGGSVPDPAPHVK